MQVTPQALRSFSTGLSTAFLVRFNATETLYKRISFEVSSTTAANEYPNFGDIPGLREWVGDRVFHELSGGNYVISNKTFEGSLSVKRDKIEDDQVGIYTQIAEQLGQSAAEFPDQLVFRLLANGDKTKGLDGQNFFDTDHPGYAADGREISVSNYQPGDGPAWYLVDDSNVIKPIVYQKRRDFTFTSLDDLRDQNVFKRNEFLYGADGRCNAGFGMWQLAYMSRAPLTAENYAKAREAMGTIRRRDGTVISIKPRLLMVPPQLEAVSRTLIGGDLVPTQIGDQIVPTSNTWRDTAEVLLVPQLA